MTIHRFLQFELDTDLLELRHSESSVAIEPQVFDLLLYLIEHRDRVVTRDELFENIWRGRIVSDATLSSRIKAARQAVGDTGKSQLILQTLPRRGFRFVAAVQDKADQPRPAIIPHIERQIQQVGLEQASKPSLAVLPFENLTSDPEQEYFADGMTEDLIDALSKFRWLVVIARGTMFTYKGKAVTEAQVSNELKVRYVLEGSIRKSGQRMRLSAQLIDTQAGGSIWSQRFDRQVDDIFAIQDEITNAIAAEIAPEIDRAERSRATVRQRVDVDAWFLYQQGLAAYYRLTEEGLHEAIDAFKKAQNVDPGFAPAFSMEAVSLARIAQNYRLDELGNLDGAADLIAKALMLDPRDPLNWWARGRVLSLIGKTSEAIESIEKAIELNPNYAMAWFGLANVLIRTPFLDRAATAIDKAIVLSPFDPFMPIFVYVRGSILVWMERYEEAVENLERAMQLGNVPVWAYMFLAVAHQTIGNTERAKHVAAEFREKFPSFSISAFRNAARRPKERNELVEACLRQLGVPES